jgi:hypothetical protein
MVALSQSLALRSNITIMEAPVINAQLLKELEVDLEKTMRRSEVLIKVVIHQHDELQPRHYQQGRPRGEWQLPHRTCLDHNHAYEKMSNLFMY